MVRGTEAMRMGLGWQRLMQYTGNSGVVRAQFGHNLPPKSFGAMVRIMLYPSSI